MTAIRDGYAVRRPEARGERLLTFAEARDEYERITGGGDPNRPFDRYFDVIKTERGTRFRKKSPRAGTQTVPQASTVQ